MYKYNYHKIIKCIYDTTHYYILSSVADPDPGSGIGAFLTPGSGIRDPE
jgi:hypothetical protein